MRTATSPTVVIGNINNRGQQKYQKKTYFLIKHKLQYKTPRSCHQMHISPVVNLKIASGAPPQTGSQKQLSLLPSLCYITRLLHVLSQTIPLCFHSHCLCAQTLIFFCSAWLTSENEASSPNSNAFCTG